MNIQFIIFECQKWTALTRTFQNMPVIPRVGESIGLYIPGYDESIGLVRQVIHWPNDPCGGRVYAAEVLVRMDIASIENFRVNDSENWAIYEGDLNIRRLEAN